MSENDEPIRVFIEESRENLERLDLQVVALDQTPSDAKLIDSIFRTLHTMKASCGFFDFNKLQEIANAGENLLGMIRDGKRAFTPRIGSVLLRVADRARRCIDEIERTGKENEEDDTGLIRSIESALSTTVLVEPIATPKQPEEIADDPAIVPTDSTVRVNLDLLDRLMDLVGELVLVRNQLVQRVEDHRDPHLVRSIKQLNEITSRLQDGIMHTRMQPIRTIWNRFHRLVRDTAILCKKEVVLKLSGEETEIDRSVIEAIRDPLTHLIRNAIDHGIEPPQERLANGKSRTGTIHLHAKYDNGQVVLTISDDGRGISAEKVVAKAIERGMISPGDAQHLTAEEMIRFIFLPSFSTAEVVTSVSGRGVGMDVVRTNLAAIGGSIDIQTVPGEGSEFRLKIPLTLAIVEGLIVGAADERFVIPQNALLEVVRLDAESQSDGIHLIDETPILRLRGRLFPLVDLSHLLKLEGSIPLQERIDLHVLIVQVDTEQFGLIVDEIHDSEEIVIKPLSGLLASMQIYSGATILGDGMLVLVIDIMGLATHAAIQTPNQEGHLPLRTETLPCVVESKTSYVIVEEMNRRFAIDLAEVRRLERFSLRSIQATLRSEVVEYGESMLPIYRLARLLNLEAVSTEGEFGSVVIVAVEGREVGLLVERIIDILPKSDEPGVRRLERENPVWIRDGSVIEYLRGEVWRNAIRSTENVQPFKSIRGVG